MLNILTFLLAQIIEKSSVWNRFDNYFNKSKSRDDYEKYKEYFVFWSIQITKILFIISQFYAIMGTHLYIVPTKLLYVAMHYANWLQIKYPGTYCLTWIYIKISQGWKKFLFWWIIIWTCFLSYMLQKLVVNCATKRK